VGQLVRRVAHISLILGDVGPLAGSIEGDVKRKKLHHRRQRGVVLWHPAQLGTGMGGGSLTGATGASLAAGDLALFAVCLGASSRVRKRVGEVSWIATVRHLLTSPAPPDDTGARIPGLCSNANLDKGGMLQHSPSTQALPHPGCAK
jgi:hypothetical protein